LKKYKVFILTKAYWVTFVKKLKRYIPSLCHIWVPVLSFV